MPGIFEKHKHFGSCCATLHADPPSGFYKYGDTVSWLVDDDIVPAASDSNGELNYSLERIETGTNDGHLVWNTAPDYIQGSPGKFSAKMLVQIKSTPTGSFILGMNPNYDYQNCGYGIALRPHTGHFDIVKFTDWKTFSDLQTSVFSFDNDTWYTIHFKKDGDTLEASIWEWGSSEPSWMVSTSDSTYGFGSTACIQLAHIDDVEAYTNYLAFATSSYYDADDPPDVPLLEVLEDFTCSLEVVPQVVEDLNLSLEVIPLYIIALEDFSLSLEIRDPGPLPESKFIANLTYGTAPLIVKFKDLSVNEPLEWLWDFGDSTPHSSDQNPTHVYESEGSYNVQLIVFNLDGNDLCTKMNYIIVNENTDYKIGGVTLEEGVPVDRTVRLYDHETGVLVKETVSSEGTFEFLVDNNNMHFMIALDDDLSGDYNILIQDKITPESV
jgi:PKD repeat protein